MQYVVFDDERIFKDQRDNVLYCKDEIEFLAEMEWNPPFEVLALDYILQWGTTLNACKKHVDWIRHGSVDAPQLLYIVTSSHQGARLLHELYAPFVDDIEVDPGGRSLGLCFDYELPR